MKVAIVLLDSLQIPYVYDAPEPSQGTYGGEWGSPQVTVHLEVPEGLDPQCLTAVREGEEITLQEDPAKVQAKLDAQWTAVRTQQRQKLYESDWTCSVTDYEVPNKSEWVQYRAQLRDVTLQTDPFNIVWPQRPTPQES
jgi:hypothetical protein